MNTETLLATFLGEFDPAMAAFACGVRERMRERLPGAVELVYDNFNALVIGYGPDEKSSHAPFSIAVYPRWINLFFLVGASIADPSRRLSGKGSQVRSLRVDDIALFDDPEIEALIQASLAVRPINPTGPRRLVIRAIAPNKRARRQVT